MIGIADLAAGSVFANDYRIVRRLAAGGMGAVYIAEQLSTGRERALKLMHPGLVGSPELRDKFALEARVGARIRSEHVVEVVGAGVDAQSGVPWLAMELLEGEDLAHAVKRRGAFTPLETAGILAQICHALGAAHAAGIVHRDLKPENVFLAERRRAQESYTVKVLDFGIAKVIAAAQGSNTGALGSPLWMAPEQTERHTAISGATDVWALGLVAFTMLTARSFWLSADATEMALASFLRELVLDDLPTASERAAALGVAALIPPGFDAWFAHAVTRERADRYPNAIEAYLALCDHLGLPPELSRTGRLPAAASPPDGQTKVTTGDAALDSRAATQQLAGPNPAAALASQSAPGGEPDRDDVAIGSTVPTVGPSPRLMAVGGVALVVLITAGAASLVRGRTTKSGDPAPADAAIAAPPCAKGMVRVASGETSIGTDAGPPEEQPAHPATVAMFCMDATEVTVSEYRDCVERAGCPAGHAQPEWPGIAKAERETWSAFCNEPRKDRSDHPMNCVSFDDASAYCRWAGKRLPTEEQWEYAARGTDGRAYPWGHEGPTPRRLNACDEGCARAARRAADTIAPRLGGDDHWEATSPVGAFPDGVSPFGLFDMSGNVAEWVDAPFCNYGQSACGSSARVVRGGSWMTDAPTAVRTTARAKASPESRLTDVGFRCVR